MTTLNSVLENNYITSMNIILPNHIHPSFVAELIEIGNMIDEALLLSGAIRTPAENFTESFARLDAKRELELISDQVIDRLYHMGLGATFETYQLVEVANDYFGDLDFHTGTGLQITISHQDELIAA